MSPSHPAGVTDPVASDRAPSSLPRIGAHVGRGRRGFVTSALEAGCDTIQIFASNPRGWAESAVNARADAELRAGLAAADVAPLFLHAPYLVNVASPDPGVHAKSIRNAAWTMRRAASLGAAGVVVHAGAGGVGSTRAEAIERARAAFVAILETSPAGPLLLVELTAGGTNTIASRWPQAAELLDALAGDQRIRLCFDTCHAHAAGYDLSTPDGAAACWEELGGTVGAERLALVHANDSKDPRGSRRDRHEQVGKGAIGDEGFRALLSHPFARRVPWVVETPPRHQAEDVARLRRLAEVATPGGEADLPTGA